MQIDEVVWQIINQGPCSFRIKTPTQNFCRNEYNVTGLCTRSSCPLANSQYATVVEKEGICYLYIKTAERSHMPNKLWEKIQLDKSYVKALQQIEEQLQYWPKFLIHKCKQRLTKIRQMLNRIRKLKLKGMPELIPIKKKTERREKIREKKAEIAANIEQQIEQELLDRLKQGIYGEIYNYNPKVFEKVVGDQEIESEREDDEIAESEINEEDDQAFIFDPKELDDDESGPSDIPNDDDDSEGDQLNDNSIEEPEEEDLGDIEDMGRKSQPKNQNTNIKKTRPSLKYNTKGYGDKLTKKIKPGVELIYEDVEENEKQKEMETN